MALKSIDEIKNCPFCGSEEGFWVVAVASGFVQTIYSFDGEHRDNSGMYNLVREKNRKYAHCNCCHKNIGVVTGDALKKIVDRTLEESERLY